MLKYLFAFILFIHGLIHIMGFAKAYGYANMQQLTKDISKPAGSIWLFACLLFIIALAGFLLKKEWWPVAAIFAVAISQLVIFMSWGDARFGTIANIIIVCVAVALWASFHFEMQFTKDVKKHITQTVFVNNDIVTDADIALLPAPVKKYLQYAGVVNKPKVKNVKIVFDGEMREKGKDYFKFNSVQYNFFDNPARLFFMKARMFGTTMPGYHCYQNATATMQVKLLGLFNVVNVKGIEMNKAETVTVFNDMCLMAPATLVDKRIEWTAIDSLSAKASFTNGTNTITATLYFNGQGQLINFISDDRYAISDMKQYRFSTPVKDYTKINGRNIMQYGETVWHYPDGEFVYGKFTLKSIGYNVAEF